MLPLLLGVGALCALALAPAANAQRLPRWLKPPYKHYKLTYEASDTAEGSDSTSTPTPGEGQTVCDWQEYSSGGSESIHATLSYSLTFGRYRPRSGPLQTAFVYQPSGHSTSGQTQATITTKRPPGCAPEWRYPTGSATATCSERVIENGAAIIEFASNSSLTKFGVFVRPDFAADEHSRACNGDEQLASELRPDSFDLDSEKGTPMPGSAEVKFTASGVKASRTFRAPIEADETPVRTGPGSSIGISGEHNVWNFNNTLTGALTLAPAHG